MGKGSGGGGGSHGVGGVGGRSARAGGGGSAAMTYESLPLHGEVTNNDKQLLSGDRAALARAEAFAKTLDPLAAEAIKEFTVSEFAKFRSIDKSGEGGTQSQREKVVAINKAMDRAPKHAVTVYRGLALTDSQIGDLIKTKELVFDAMASSSRSAKMAQTFIGSTGYGKRGVFMQIRQKSGIPVESISEIKGEREIMIRKGTAIKITSVSRGIYDGDEILIVKGKEITKK
ncbi:MAG: hypothetical protein WC551_07515 [Patescibacteria group bacterium]